MPIVLQETLRGVFYAPFYAALSLGAYREEGVEVRFTSARTPSDSASRLADGTVDVTWGGPMRVMLTYDEDPKCDLVCFCEVVTRDPFFLLGRAPNPDFKLADLMRKRVATVSEVPTPWLCLQEDMRRAGLDPAGLDRVTDRSMACSCSSRSSRSSSRREPATSGMPRPSAGQRPTPRSMRAVRCSPSAAT